MKNLSIYRILILQLVVLSILVVTSYTAYAGITTRVSVSSNGTQENNEARYYNCSSISADGRFIVFASDADNLVPNDTNGQTDVFVHDRQTGQTDRVSVSSDGTQGNNSSEPNRDNSSISADGRFVVFESNSDNLVPCDTNEKEDVFVHDRQTGQTELVSVANDGNQGNYSSHAPSISADGRYVAFLSHASNLVPNDINHTPDVFVYNRLIGQIERVSVASNGTQENDWSVHPTISADGRFVAFASYASNLVSNDTNGVGDVFVHDRLTGQTTRISVSSDGTQGNGYSDYPSISADGRYVSFTSRAENLVLGDAGQFQDVFVHDQQTGQTERVSVTSSGAQGNNNSYNSVISADGRYVEFYSRASNLVSYDINGYTDAFVYDRLISRTEIVSISSDDKQGNNHCNSFLSISSDGRYVVFGSYANNLVPGDTNGCNDVFVRDRLGGNYLVGLKSDGRVYYTSNMPNWINIPGKLTKVALGDFDGDDAYDIAGLSLSGKIYYTTDRSTWINIPGTLSSLVTGDFNEDGNDDIAGISTAGKVFYTTNKTNWRNIPTPGRLSSIYVGDLNEFGGDDIVVLDEYGGIYYSIDKAAWKTVPGKLDKLAVGDLNGDGADDIAGLSSPGNVYYLTDKNVGWKEISGKLTCLAIGDLDGNSRDDIVGLNPVGKIYYTTTKTTWHGINGVYASFAVGDLDDSGTDDIAALETNGSVWYTTNKRYWTNIPGTFAQLYCTK